MIEESKENEVPVPPEAVSVPASQMERCYPNRERKPPERYQPHCLEHYLCERM